MKYFKTIDDAYAYGDIKTYRKTAKIQAVQIDEEFMINAPEYEGKVFPAGSFVGINPDNGDIWRIAEDTFYDTYAEVEDAGYESSEGVEILHSHIDYKDFFRIDKVGFRYQLPNGNWVEPPFDSLIFERGDAVGLLVYDVDTGEFVMERQFRMPTYTKDEGWITEIPAGMIKNGESPRVAALRELQEELGYIFLHDGVTWDGQRDIRDYEWDTDVLTYIRTFYVSPGGSSERIVLYYVEVDSNTPRTAGRGLAGEYEHIIEERIPFSQTKIATFMDAKTIIAVNWWWLSGWEDEV